MSIADHIERVRSAIRQGTYTSEAAVSQGIVLPTLHELGWPVFDTSIVIPEYSVEGRRVDFALCHPPERPTIFVEVKKIGSIGDGERQLFEYAFHLGVPMAILTDGQEWGFYLPGEQGSYSERRVYKLDLLERDTNESVTRLERYLDYQRTRSGDTLKSAREDYRNVFRDKEIEETMPRAWSELLADQDSLLLELLAEKVEDLCGYKPDLDLCGDFLARLEKPVASSVPVPPSPRGKSRKGKATNKFEFTFDGELHSARSAREVMVRLFEIIAAGDANFMERYAARKHGKKRRYIARNKAELYPGRPDLAEEHSIEIVPGWWLGTNYSRSNIQQIIDLALDLLPPDVRARTDIKVI